MECSVVDCTRVERDNELPYFVIRAIGVEGDQDAEAIDENGFINPLACMSRRFNFVKTLFPVNNRQVQGLTDAFFDASGEFKPGAKVRLMPVVWAAPKAFLIKNDSSNTGYYESSIESEETTTKNGKTVKKVVTTFTAKIYNTVNLTVFESNGKCTEGDPDTLCKTAYERGLSSGVYVPYEEGTELPTVTV